MYLTVTNICAKCNIEKEIDIRYGLYKACKTCVKTYQQKYYENNRERILEQTKQYLKDNPDKKKIYDRRYYQTHRDILLEKQRQVRLQAK